MKKTQFFVLMLCLLLTACSKPNNEEAAAANGAKSGEGTRSENAGTGATNESPTANDPIMLYPAYLQTPLNMPVLLDARTYPEGKKLNFSSSDPSVATVDAKGCITPVGTGEATITCALADDAGIIKTCGVLVVTEGDILLWEYPLEPVDTDAVLAQLETAGESQPEDEPSLPWPDAWPQELPKIDCGITYVFGETAESADGLQVIGTVKDLDTVKAYVEQLAALGYEPEKYPIEMYYVICKGKRTEISVSYDESNRGCTIIVKK